MPIYAYKCAACGHAKDVLQKISEAPLSVCPACGAASFVKQVTAAGFQLKGSGWYVTDFRDGGKDAKKKTSDTASNGEAKGDTGEANKTQSTAGESAKPAESKPATPSTPTNPSTSGS